MDYVDLRELAQGQKKLAIKPSWQALDSTWFRLTCALAIGAEIIPGLELRGRTGQTRSDRDVSFHLQYYPPKGPCTPLARVDWKPIASHTNPQAGPAELQLARIEGSHVHSFELNWIESMERVRTAIPIAEPLRPDPANFSDLLAVVGNAFRISGLELIERPDWRMPGLFGD